MFLAASCAAVPTVSTRPVSLGPRESGALVLTRIPSPWWAPAFLITSKFVDSIPDYAAVPGLLHKTYTLADDGRFGGLYLWPDRASAEAYFDEAWHRGVKARRGVEADVHVFDAPWTVQAEAPTGRALPQHALRTDAAVTWVSVSNLKDAEPKLRALAAVHGLPSGLIRASFVTEPAGTAGVLGLWTSRAAAEAFWTQERLGAASSALGGEASVVWFSAPVLLDVAAARADARRATLTPAVAPR